MPKAYDVQLPGTHASCPECDDASRYLRTVGPHIGEFCGKGHRIGDWLGRELFVEGGSRFGQLPPEDFDKRHHRRAKRYALLEHVAVALRAEPACFWCGTEAYHGPRQASSVKNWIRAWRPELHNRLLERFKRNDGTDMAVVPKDWPTVIDRTFYREIEQELESSGIEADHLIPVRLVELMKPDAAVTAAMLKYAGRDLGVPSCRRCNRGRYRAAFDYPERIMDLWRRYRFDDNVAAAKADPSWNTILALATAAYRLDQDLERLKRRTG